RAPRDVMPEDRSYEPLSSQLHGPCMRAEALGIRGALVGVFQGRRDPEDAIAGSAKSGATSVEVARAEERLRSTELQDRHGAGGDAVLLNVDAASRERLRRLVPPSAQLDASEHTESV